MAGLITTPFGATTTAMEVVEGVDLRGKRAIVTGGSSGIGVETARALAQAGAQVMLAVRNTDAGEQTAEDIRQTTGNQNILVGQLDLSDLNSVRAFVRGWEGLLDILVNNAGVMAIPQREVSAQGHEMQFATNHLGHFALALGLHDALAATGHARIISVSSVGHINGEVDFDDIDFLYRPYGAWVSYGQSKTANILFAVEAARRLGRGWHRCQRTQSWSHCQHQSWTLLERCTGQSRPIRPGKPGGVDQEYRARCGDLCFAGSFAVR